MEETKVSAQEIEKGISVIEKNGIGIDRKQVLKDMCSQFINYWEWLREYSVNASDALATLCTITIEELSENILIRVEDDGHGMPKEMVLVFMTLFKSVKFGKRNKTVGCHGVGKLSVFASEHLTGFAMATSTGKECWQMKTGSLLDNVPVTINQIEPVPPQGTRFEISFDKTLSHEQILSRARQVLNQYCQYLPMEIVFKAKSRKQGINSEERIKGNWNFGPERMPQVFQGNDDAGRYEVIIGINNGTHSVYQNRVLISDRYDLLEIDGTKDLYLPGLDIRVDSPDFKPNFGRNKLTNESFLSQICSKVKQRLIPKYFNQLAELYLSGDGMEIGIGYSRIESLACGILKYRPGWIRSAAELPIFRLKNGEPISFLDLTDQVKRAGKCYLENTDSTGIDFSVYDGPVLSLNQPSGGLDLLKKKFASSLINLGLNDVVFEIPAGSSRKLGPRELAFEKMLGFKPGIFNHGLSVFSDDQKSKSKTIQFSSSLMENGFLDKVCEESKDAQTQLEHFKWKVNYLVDRDGKTPNTTHRFLVKDYLIVLNLNHPEIQQLLKISRHSGNLAGYWAMALCLCEGNSLLKHLTPEAREDLLIIDAMSRLGKELSPDDDEKNPESYDVNTQFDFERNNLDLWL